MNYKNKTTMLTKEETRATRKWYLLDASGKTLGRFAAEVATILKGKHKVNYTPHSDSGDGVVVINADKIQVTGAKERQKLYSYYTGYVGGLRQIPYSIMKDRKPDYIITHAVKGMMSKTKLSNAQLKRLRVFAGEAHDMQAQQPIPAQI